MKVLICLCLSSLLFSKPFKVASYNVENLFDTINNGMEYKEYIPYTHQWNSKNKEIKLNHIAEVICDIDADIIGLQEVENKNILKQLVRRLKEVGCGYKYFAITDKKSSTIQIALLSRFKIIDTRDIMVSCALRVRNILEVTVLIENMPLTLFINHWKSKAYNGVESKRIIYAEALKNRLKYIKNEYIILGDFNSNYDEYLHIEKKLNDTKGKTGINNILNTTYENYLVDKFTLRYSGKKLHYNLWQELNFEKRWSHNFYGKKSTLDAIIVSYQMFDGQRIDYIKDSFHVFNPSYLFNKKGYIKRWMYKNGKHLGKGYSDHLAIYAFFDKRPYRGKFNKIEHSLLIRTIDDLYKVEILKNSLVLKKCVVIFKRGHHAVIKQNKNTRGIYLYGGGDTLKEGYSYDLMVQNIKEYHGLKEVTQLYTIKKLTKVSKLSFYTKNLNKLQQNEIIFNIKGVYKNHFFYSNGKKIAIYFKKRKSTPKNGSYLKIKYGHIGYYKGLQLVIYSKKDFEILEK